MAIELTTIKDVEIFRAGDYPQGNFPRSVVKAMAASYDPELLDAPVTTDHRQEGPALGWLRNPREANGVLLADFDRVPVEFAEQIKSGAWLKRSVEFFDHPDVDVVKKTGGAYLKAVTMLGAGAPAVKGLKDPDVNALAEATGFVICKTDYPFKSVGFRPAQFKQPTTDPNPGDHGTIMEDQTTTSILDHFHFAHLDKDGNGFTGDDMEFDDETFALKPGRSGHIHLVMDGVVQEGGHIPHLHEVHGFPREFSQATSGLVITYDPKEGETMNDTEKKLAQLETDMVEVKAKFTAIEVERDALRTENDGLRATAEEAITKGFRSASLATFTASVDERIEKKAISPGEKDPLVAAYSAALDGAITAGAREVGHAGMTVCKSLTDIVAGRKEAKLFSADPTGGADGDAGAGQGGAANVVDVKKPMTKESSDALHSMCEELQAAHFKHTGDKMSYSDAMKTASRRLADEAKG